MRSSTLIAALLHLLLLLHGAAAQNFIDETIYFLTVTSRAVGGSTEKLCVHVRPRPQGTCSLKINLELGQTLKNILSEGSMKGDFYRCLQFQLPDVRVESEATISVHIQEDKTTVNKVTKILVKPRSEVVFFQTDKPIYKPGQTVKFRLVSLSSSFLIFNQKFPTIELQDPMSNRISQWLNVSTSSGLADLSYPTSTESPHGVYIITAWNQKNEAITQTFEISEYVLPKFEVTVESPSVITILDTSATVKVCAKYTYGKPVNGSVSTAVCRSSFRYWWYRPENHQATDICKNVSVTTDRTGCASHVLDLKDFALLSPYYQDIIRADSEVEEYGTGVIMKGSGSITVTTNIVTVTFEDLSSAYKLGLNYEGKIKVIGPNSNPLKNKTVTLTIRYGNTEKVQNLVTNTDGVAKFSLQTEQWGGQTSVSLEAQYQKTVPNFGGQGNIRTPSYPTAYQVIQPFFSNSGSFVTLERSQEPLSCNRNALVKAQYLIQGISLRPQQPSLLFYYMVMSRGRLAQQGKMPVSIRAGKENRGQVSFQLNNVQSLTPVAQVVIYTLLPTGEAVADSMDFPIQLCLPNKVSLNFTSEMELPGMNTTLELRAHPGSLCSLRCIDQSLLLLKPEKELNIKYIFGLLPVQKLSGYPHNIDEENTYCLDSPLDMGMGMGIGMGMVPMLKRRFFNPFGGVNDVYNIFKNIGIKIVTNAVVKKRVQCYQSLPFLRRDSGAADKMAFNSFTTTMPAPTTVLTTMEREREEKTAAVSQSAPPITTVRKYFPETWIWDLVPVGKSGRRNVAKTVPDTITTWEAEAFCMSPVGFGVAPRTKLTAFQPFFVSLSMPSSVIRGEVFTLKATVFNYLQSCIMVKVTLGPSQQFTVQPCRGCVYTRCLCADESFTFTWTIKPQALGQVTISVTAEAVQSSTRCGNKTVTVPQKGRVDTVINTLLVLAEGTKETKTFNELMCPSGALIWRTVLLKLPEVCVSGSATASVSVLGDLMGRALKNLASLLAMPYGCGEQNMLLFAPNIFILQYLESSAQLTAEIRSKAETFLISGYQRELTYKHTDGSYSAFGMSDPSGNTWLTAFVMKSFWAAKRYIFIAQTEVDQARAWLGQRQQANGCFASVGQLFHTDMKGGVNDEVTLSAYIIAALLELGVSTTDPVVTNGLTCLRNADNQVTSTYALALMSYTFTLAQDRTMRTSLLTNLNARAIVSDFKNLQKCVTCNLQKLDPFPLTKSRQNARCISDHSSDHVFTRNRRWSSRPGRHWSRETGGTVDSLEVEMTSYVLLALLSGPFLSGFDMGYCASIVQWLAQQQNAFGGFASTQDTVVALQALAKYSAVTYSPTGSVQVTVTSPSGVKKEFTVNQSNRLLYQESQLQEVSGRYKVRAGGSGCVYVQFTLRYNIPPPADYSSFSITGQTKGNCNLLTPTVEVTVTIKYNGNREKTNMVIIEVKLLSGFTIDKTSVMQATTKSGTTNGAVKRVDLLEGHVFIYLNELKKGEERSYSMLVVQETAVQNLKPAVMKVYDYYETGDVAVAQYSSPCVTK